MHAYAPSTVQYPTAKGMCMNPLTIQLGQRDTFRNGIPNPDDHLALRSLAIGRSKAMLRKLVEDKFTTGPIMCTEEYPNSR